MAAQEEAAVGALVVDYHGKAHLPGDGLEGLCGAPGDRWMHPAEQRRLCGWCAAVAFGWN